MALQDMHNDENWIVKNLNLIQDIYMDVEVNQEVPLGFLLDYQMVAVLLRQYSRKVLGVKSLGDLFEPGKYNFLILFQIFLKICTYSAIIKKEPLFVWS